MFINLKIKSKNDIDNLKRKEYLNKLYTKHNYHPNGDMKIGIIEKFNNAIGFKKVTSHTDNNYVVNDNIIESPEWYKSPYEILLSGLNPCLNDNDIASFIIKKETIKHYINDYTYDTETIIIKLKRFLGKIFPDLIMTIDYLDEINQIPVTEFVLNNFFLALDYEKVYTVEVSISRLLNENEINHILDILKTITTLDISIKQEKCETCSNHSGGKSPYHIEIIYEDLVSLYS